MGDSRLMTDKQSKYLFALLRESGVDHVTGETVTDRHAWASDVLGCSISSFTQLSVTDARRLIDRLVEPVEYVEDGTEAF